MRKKLKAKALVMDYQTVLRFKEGMEMLDWTKVVGGRRCSLEIGMGKGKFITEMARQRGDEFFLGMEVKEERVLSAAKKIELMKLSNVRLILGDAQDLAEMKLEGMIDVIYLNFSDPWPKKRHAKRRLTSPGYLAIYRRLMRTDGRLIMKTDNEKLFEYSLEVMTNDGWKIVQVDRQYCSVEAPVTEFEKKFLERGCIIHYFEGVAISK